MSDKIVGNYWYKFDFHTHTPASTDYRESIEPTPEDWLKSLMEKKIDCVAITDHNTGEWVDKVVRAYTNLDKSLSWFRTLHIFPGVEITLVNGANRIHMLAIFDPKTTSATITSALGGCEIFDGFGDPELTSTEKSFSDVVNIINKIGGIAIPAHVDGPKGLLENVTTSTPDILKTLSNIQTIQCINKDFPTSETLALNFQKELAKLAVVRGSDAHRLNELGQAYTWIKLSSLNIDSLRFSLQDFEFSVLNQTEDPNKKPFSYISSVRIKDMAHCGARGEPLKISLHPQFNSIIGGRGSGKSTVIESIRLSMARVDEVKKAKLSSIANEINSFQESVVKPTTSIEVHFTRNNTQYATKWLGDGSSTIEKMLSDGTWINDGSNIKDRFPINIYSQKQIYAFAANTEGLLGVIDRSDLVDIGTWKQQYSSIVNNYKQASLSIQLNKESIDKENNLNSNLADLNTDIATFEEGGHASIFENYQKAAPIKRQIEQCANSETLEELLKQISELTPEKLNLAEDCTPFTSEHIDEVKQAHNCYLQEVTAIITEANVLETRLTSAKLLFKQSIDSSDWNNTASQFTNEHESVLATYGDLDTGEDNAFTPETYKEWLTQRDKIIQELTEISDLKVTQGTLKQQRETFLTEIFQAREDLQQRRQRFIDHTLSENPYVKMTVKPYVNKQTLEESFRKLLDTDKFSTAILDLESNQGLLYKMMQIDLSKDTTDIQVLAKQELDAIKQEISNLASGVDPSVDGVNGRFKTFIASKVESTPSFLDDLQLWAPEDFLDVRYARNMGQSSNPRFESISKGSAGQKSAAILAFLLSHGDDPIIVDQPEDDLDNSLIYNLIVNQIHRNRVQRQIIMVTHNPNIVVNGDADMVNVLEFRGGQVNVKVDGGLTVPEVKAEVCEIMEGGQEAFAKRFKRISTFKE